MEDGLVFLKRSVQAVVAVAVLMAAAPAAAAADGPDAIQGVWRNPKNSVHVDIKPCGKGMCGYVVWASPKAQKDVKEAGGELLGMQLLRNFEKTDRGAWRGKVYVPDVRATFSGTAELVDSNTLRAKGCLFAGIGCKVQLWKRLSAAAD
jgi:uncharacterized protein (DUF2147 family)